MASDKTDPAAAGRPLISFGRVRSGCMTCRARKVKCDEARPVCAKCKRLDRQCVYKPRKTLVSEHGRHSLYQPATCASSTHTAHGPRIVELSDKQARQWSAGSDISTTGASPSTSVSTSSTPPSTRITQISNRDGSVRSDGPRHDDVSFTEHGADSPATAQSEPSIWTNRHDGRYILTMDEDTPEQLESPSALISRDIHLTTTMDILVARGTTMPTLGLTPAMPSSINFFLEEVDCPGITSFDPVTWTTVKRHVVRLCETSELMTKAVNAVCAVYTGQLLAISVARAKTLYTSARQLLQEQLESSRTSMDREHVLLASFFLCCSEMVHSDELIEGADGPLFKGCDTLASSLEEWADSGEPSLTPMMARIIAWLRIMHRITHRGGGTGLISDKVYGLLCRLHGETHDADVTDTNIPSPHGRYIESPAHQEAAKKSTGSPASLPAVELDPQASSQDVLFQALSGPLFGFYYRLQLLSGQIARLTHYHRSRSTAHDQDVVASRIADIRSRLRTLWTDTKTGAPGSMTTCGLDARALETQLAPEVASRLITLMRLCETAYLAEIVELDRVLGDPVERYSKESRHAVHAITRLVEAAVNDNARSLSDVLPLPGSFTRGRHRLNPGFLRPLFLCSIETIDDPRQTEWAVSRMAEIADPIHRSDFFAAFGRALAEAQKQKERRVTSKYFCSWYFGVSPPFL